MGFIDNPKTNNLQFINANFKDGYFSDKNKQAPAFEGKFLGWFEFETDFGGAYALTEKVAIILESDGTKYQIQFNKFSYGYLALLNCLSSAKPNLGDLITLVFVNKGKFPSLNVSLNNVALKWAYTYDTMKLTGLKGAKQVNRRNELIEKIHTTIFTEATKYAVNDVDTIANESDNDSNESDDVPF
jgi:hypothetical protein